MFYYFVQLLGSSPWAWAWAGCFFGGASAALLARSAFFRRFPHAPRRSAVRVCRHPARGALPRTFFPVTFFFRYWN